MQRLEDLSALIARIAALPTTAQDDRSAARLGVEILLELTGIDNGALIVAGQADRAEVLYTRGVPDSYTAFVKSEYMNLPGARIIVTGQPLVVSDVMVDPAYEPFRERYQEAGFRGMALFPQRQAVGGAAIDALASGQRERSELFGVLGLYHSQPVTIERPVIDLANLFASLIAATLCNFRLHRDRQHYAREVVLERTQAFVGPLAAGIAHDLNNMLGVVMAVASLAPKLDRASQSDMLAQLALEAEQASGLTRSLLDLSRVTLPGQEVAVCDVLTAARQAVELVRPTAHPETTMVVQGPPGGCRARIEPAGFSRILLNLLLNAVQAIGTQGRTGAIEVRASVSGDRCVVEVDDNGPGVPAELAERIFVPFVSHGRPGGSGIGLASARALAERAGGLLALRHRPGPGACFAVDLPLTPSEPETPAPEPARSRPAATARIPRPARVLLAEDEPIQRLVFAAALRSVGHLVTEVGTGLEATELIDRDAFDLLILDQRMPGLTGQEVLAHARARGARMPVLLVSGYAVDPTWQEVHDGVEIVSKPLTGEALLERVAAQLAARRTPLP